jgi:hypothetical protein
MVNYNPLAIDVSVLGDGCYLARVRHGEPVLVNSPFAYKDFAEWLLDMDDTQLEAALQIYWDRWTFQTGKEDDNLALEALEEERKRRSQSNSTFAPGIFR